MTGRHFDDDGDGIADAAQYEAALLEHDEHEPGCCEDRAAPSSWDDPQIAAAWADPLALDDLDPEAWALEEPPVDTAARRSTVELARKAGGVYLNTLPDVIRAGGLTVVVDPGWQRRNHGAMAAVTAVVCHHTGSSGAGAWTVVRDGRSDLAGPLAQLTIERDGSVRVLANGQAWHAGTGSWPSIGRNNANSQAIGIECVYNGSDITDAQRRTYVLLVAALVRGYRIPIGNVIAHREWAPTRKTDPGRIDMPSFRRDVQAAVTGAPAPAAPTPAPANGRPDVSVDNYPYLRGKGRLVLGAPVGGGAWATDGYLSVTVVEGKGSAHVYAQGTKAGVADWWHPENELTVNTTKGAPDENLARRSPRRVPAGTSVLVIYYDFTTAGPDGGTVTLELK